MNEKPWSIGTLLTEHPSVAIDANVLIYLFENDEPHADRAAALVDAVEAHGLRVTLATVGQIEVLTGPARTGDAAAFETMADEIAALGLGIVALTQDIANDAAWIRGQGRLELADAIHVASARAAGATAFVTNDRRIGSRPGLEVVYLDDLVA